MDPRIKNVLLTVQDAGPLAAMYAAGFAPGDIKEAVVGLLATYSSNHQALSRYAIEFMVADAISLARVERSAWATRLLVEAVRLRRDSLAADQDACMQLVAASQRSIHESVSRYWSHLHLARDLRPLALDEFAHEVLRYIGTLVEGVAKAFLYELASHAELARGRAAQAASIGDRSLGQVLDVLEHVSGSTDTYRRHGIRLNQWRNAAQHFSVRVVANQIHVLDQRGALLVGLDRDEFENVLHDLMNAFRAFSVANSVFFFDHLDELRTGGHLPGPFEARPEAEMVVLAAGLASQGFELVNADFGQEVAILVVRDQTELEPMGRQVHASQFLFPVYRHAPADVVEIEYQRRDGTPTFRASASRALIDRALAVMDRDPTLLAREARYFDIVAGREIPPSPRAQGDGSDQEP